MTAHAPAGFDPGRLERPRVQRTADPANRLSLARRVMAPMLLLAIWAAATGHGQIDPLVLPSPGKLGATFLQLWHDGLLRQVGISLMRAVIGGAFGMTIGLVLGVAAGLFRLGEESFDALLQMLRTVPFLALVPLFIVWFGVDETPKLMLIALATIFPVYLNTYSGVRNVDRKVIEAARSFGLKGARLMVEVVLPLALPSILTGLRFSLGVAVLVLIAAEQINAATGLGYLLNTAQMYQQVDVLLVCIAIYALLGLAGDLLVRLLEKSLMPWRAGVAAR